jgi:hypothetical protein
MKTNIKHWIDRRFPDNFEVSFGKEIRVNCPFCEERGKSPDTKQHLYISQVKPVANCFRCGWSGSYVWLIKQVDNCTIAKAYEQIEAVTPDIGSATQILKDLTTSTKSGVVDTTEGVPVGFVPLMRQTYKDNTLAYMAVHYLITRGLDINAIFSGKWGIVEGKPYVFTTIENKFWQGRRIIKGDPKYLNPTLSKSQGILFNGHHLVDPDYPPLYVVEGIFSATTLEKRNKVHAVALLAKTAVESQRKRLAAYKGKLIIMLDSDATSNAITLANQLYELGHTDLAIAKLKEGDPDE